ncbi:MAG: phosphoenolpyruvate carboxykinase (ATP), partial [Rhizobiaceae bacterium]
MEEFGERNPARGLDQIGFGGAKAAYYNLTEAALYEEALQRKEARLSAHGALVAATGQHTGRSARDKYIVRDANTDAHVWWDNNRPMSPEHFETLLADFKAHAAGRELFVQDLVGGADETHRLAVRVVNELAWHSLFIRNLLIRPERSALATFEPEMTIIDLP